MEKKKFEQVNDREMEKVTGGGQDEIDWSSFDWEGGSQQSSGNYRDDAANFEYKVGERVRYDSISGSGIGVVRGYHRGCYVISANSGSSDAVVVEPERIIGRV